MFHLAPGGYFEHLDALLLLTLVALQVIIILRWSRLFLRLGTGIQLRRDWGISRLLRFLVRDGDQFVNVLGLA